MAENTMPSVSDFLPEIICLGIDCAVCGILYSAYYFTNRAVSSIASAAKNMMLLLPLFRSPLLNFVQIG